MFIYEILYLLEVLSLSANAIFFVVAATALLLRLDSITKKLSITVDTKKSSFTIYKLIFSLVLLQSLALVIFVENFKQQVGILIWIIYVSALMVLFLIFLALSISDSFFSYKKIEMGSLNFSTLYEKSFKNFSIFTYFTLFILFQIISYELTITFAINEFIAPIINGSYNYKFTITTYSRELIDSNDIFNVIKRDFSNSTSHYMLSAALQAVCLIIVIFTLILS